MIENQIFKKNIHSSKKESKNNQFIGGSYEKISRIQATAKDIIELIPNEDKRICFLEKVLISCFDPENMTKSSSDIALNEELLSQLVKLDIEKNVIVGNKIRCIGLDLTSSNKKHLVIDDLLEKLESLIINLQKTNLYENTAENKIDFISIKDRLKNYYREIAVWDELAFAPSNNEIIPIGDDTYIRLSIMKQAGEQKLVQNSLKPTESSVLDNCIGINSYNIPAEKIITPQQLFDEEVFSNAISCNKRIVVTGRAGTGKSTLAKYLLQIWLRENERESKFAWIFYIKLSALIEIPDPEEILKTGPRLAVFLHRILFSAQGLSLEHVEILLNHYHDASSKLIILEGFDETPPSHRILAKKLFETQEAYVLLTSRPDDIEDFPIAAISGRVEVLGFDDEQIEKFILNHYFRSSATGQQLFKDLKKEKHYKIWELCHLPINLVYICYLWHQNSNDQNYTFTTETLIYKQLVEDLIEKNLTRQKKKILPKIGKIEWTLIQKKVKESLLKFMGDLAFHAIQHGHLIEEDYFVDLLDKFLPQGAKEKELFMLVSENSGIFTKIKLNRKNYYGFIYPSIQEYNAATYLVEKFKQEKDTFLTEFIKEKRNHNSNLIYFAVGLLSQEKHDKSHLNSFLTLICETLTHYQHLLFCFKCLSEVPDERLVDLLEEMQSLIIAIVQSLSNILSILSSYRYQQQKIVLQQIVTIRCLIHNKLIWSELEKFFLAIMKEGINLELVEIFALHYPDKIWNILNEFIKDNTKIDISVFNNLLIMCFSQNPKLILTIIGNNLVKDDFNDSDYKNHVLSRIDHQYIMEIVSIVGRFINSTSKDVRYNCLRIIEEHVTFISIMSSEFLEGENAYVIMKTISNTLHDEHKYIARSAYDIIMALCKSNNYGRVFDYLLSLYQDSNYSIASAAQQLLKNIFYEFPSQVCEHMRNILAANNMRKDKVVILLLLSECFLLNCTADILNIVLPDIRSHDTLCRYAIYNILINIIHSGENNTAIIPDTNKTLMEYSQKPETLITSLENESLEIIINRLTQWLDLSADCNPRKIAWLLLEKFTLFVGLSINILDRIVQKINLSDVKIINNFLILLSSVADQKHELILPLLPCLVHATIKFEHQNPHSNNAEKIYISLLRLLIEKKSPQAVLNSVLDTMLTKIEIPIINSLDQLLIEYKYACLSKLVSLVIAKANLPNSPIDEMKIWNLLCQLAEDKPHEIYALVKALLERKTFDLEPMKLNLILRVAVSLARKLSEPVFSILSPQLHELSTRLKIPFTNITIPHLISSNEYNGIRLSYYDIIYTFFNILQILVLDYKSDIIGDIKLLLTCSNIDVKSGIIGVLETIKSNFADEVLELIIPLLCDKDVCKQAFDLIIHLSKNKFKEVIKLFEQMLGITSQYHELIEALSKVIKHDVTPHLPLLEKTLITAAKKSIGPNTPGKAVGLYVEISFLHNDEYDEKKKMEIKNYFIQKLNDIELVTKEVAISVLSFFNCTELLQSPVLQKLTIKQATALFSNLKPSESNLRQLIQALRHENRDLLLPLIIEKIIAWKLEPHYWGLKEVGLKSTTTHQPVYTLLLSEQNTAFFKQLYEQRKSGKKYNLALLTPSLKSHESEEVITNNFLPTCS